MRYKELDEIKSIKCYIANIQAKQQQININLNV